MLRLRRLFRQLPQQIIGGRLVFIRPNLARLFDEHRYVSRLPTIPLRAFVVRSPSPTPRAARHWAHTLTGRIRGGISGIPTTYSGSVS